jgi:predicted small lipoprotein YifL
MRRLGLLFAVLLLTALSGCGLGGPVGSFFGGCDQPDDDLVEAVMATARTDFAVGEPGNQIEYSRVEFLRAASAELPEDSREFGMTELVAIMVAAWYADAPSDTFAGVHTPVMFVVSEDHSRFVPVNRFGLTAFDSDDPLLEDPAWQAWVESITWGDPDTYAEPWGSVHDCVHP